MRNSLSAGSCPAIEGPCPSVVPRQMPTETRRGLLEVDAVGSGVMLIARRVLEKVKIPFERKWNDEGVPIKGLDFYFCDKAKALGFKIFVHWEYLCSHFKKVDLVWILKLLGGKDVG